MQIIIMHHSMHITGKAKDVCRYLREAQKRYLTVKELINSKLN